MEAGVEHEACCYAGQEGVPFSHSRWCWCVLLEGVWRHCVDVLFLMVCWFDFCCGRQVVGFGCPVDKSRRSLDSLRGPDFVWFIRVPFK
jgi:hypothetical protein